MSDPFAQYLVDDSEESEETVESVDQLVAPAQPQQPPEESFLGGTGAALTRAADMITGGNLDYIVDKLGPIVAGVSPEEWKQTQATEEAMRTVEEREGANPVGAGIGTGLGVAGMLALPGGGASKVGQFGAGFAYSGLSDMADKSATQVITDGVSGGLASMGLGMIGAKMLKTAKQRHLPTTDDYAKSLKKVAERAKEETARVIGTMGLPAGAKKILHEADVKNHQMVFDFLRKNGAMSPKTNKVDVTKAYKLMKKEVDQASTTIGATLDRLDSSNATKISREQIQAVWKRAENAIARNPNIVNSTKERMYRNLKKNFKPLAQGQSEYISNKELYGLQKHYGKAAFVGANSADVAGLKLASRDAWGAIRKSFAQHVAETAPDSAESFIKAQSKHHNFVDWARGLEEPYLKKLEAGPFRAIEGATKGAVLNPFKIFGGATRAAGGALTKARTASAYRGLSMTEKALAAAQKSPKKFFGRHYDTIETVVQNATTQAGANMDKIAPAIMKIYQTDEEFRKKVDNLK